MGRSCSKCCVSVVLPTNISFDQIPASTYSSIASKPTRIIQNCITIWLFDDPSNKFENEKKQLSRLIYGFQIFTDPDTCINYIRAIQVEKVFLIISVTYQSIQYLYDLPQLEKVYIFDKFAHRDQSQPIQSNIFHDINTLCKNLQEDVELCELDLIDVSVISNLTHDTLSPSSILSKEEALFIFIKSSQEILARLKFESVAKDVFIDFCRINYMNNPEQLRLIDEFEKQYRPNLALNWLKRPCFLSKLLNRVERTHEVDIIYKLGFFIKHLHMQLIRLHEENESLLNDISIVYRGKTMFNDEFNHLVKNNCGSLLSFSNFLITTLKIEQAIEFIHRRLTMHPDRVGIIFEIHIDHTAFNQDNPFALLKDNATENDEVYFSPGTVFSIESIETLNQNSLMMWLVKLKSIKNDDPKLIRLLKFLQSNELHDNPLAFLGKLLIDMGEYEHSEQFFLEMLNDTSILSQPRRLIRARNGLAANYAYKGDYATALVHYEQALQVSLTYLSSDHCDLAPLYKNIADCYLHHNNYRDALQNYERALNLLGRSTHSAKVDMMVDLQKLIDHIRSYVEKNN